MLYDDFKPIVDLVLNNWTALQLAVEHGMGAPGGKQTAQLMSVYVARYCVENIIDRDDLLEVIEDLMDEEFETVCHDESPKEIATLLIHFLTLLKDGHHDELRSQLEALPKCQMWLSQPVRKSVPPQCHGNPDDDTTSSSDDDGVQLNGGGDQASGGQQQASGGQPSTSNPSQEAEPMEEDSDPGWSTVRTRKRK